MAGDKYSAIWVSHTSMSDFLNCPRSYFLKHVYRDPKSNNKIKIMSPPLALGQAVHEVIEQLSWLKTEKRLQGFLMDRFDEVWNNFTGKKGGFRGRDVENTYKNRGREMINRIAKNPGPIARPAVKITKDLPYYWISEEDNIILCGKVDWLEYLPETDSVHIIDFKTSKYKEDGDSLQLPIYYLLVKNNQKRDVEKMSYWYLETNDALTPAQLPNAEDATKRILDIAREIKTARKLEVFKCEQEGCQYCKPMEAILEGNAEYIGVDQYGADTYILDSDYHKSNEESIIL